MWQYSFIICFCALGCSLLFLKICGWLMYRFVQRYVTQLRWIALLKSKGCHVTASACRKWVWCKCITVTFSMSWKLEAKSHKNPWIAPWKTFVWVTVNRSHWVGVATRERAEEWCSSCYPSATWPFSVTLEGSVGFKSKIGKGDALRLQRGTEQQALVCSPLSQRMPVTQEIPRDVSVSHLWEAKVQRWRGTIWASCHLRCALLQNLWEGDKALTSNKAASGGVWGNICLYVWIFHYNLHMWSFDPACRSIYANSTLIWSH